MSARAPCRVVVLLSAVFAIGGGLGAHGASAQRPTSDVLAAGVRAYQNLDFAFAADLFERALAQLPGGGLTSERGWALSYLGAADLFRGRRDSATAVFRQLVLLDPRYRLDPVIFPPEVTSLYQDVRRGTKVVLIEVAPDQAVHGEAAPFRTRLVASSFHTVEVALRRPDGMLVRTLYTGPIGDSLDVQWDGLDASGRPTDPGRLSLQVSSRGANGQVVRLVQVALDVRTSPIDTVAAPPPLTEAALLPEHTRGGPGVRQLFGGFALTGAVAVLPSLISGHADATSARFVVGGALGLAGIVGFIRGRPGRAIPENIRANQTRRDAWTREAARVTAENAKRRREVSIAVHAGPMVVIESEGS